MSNVTINDLSAASSATASMQIETDTGGVTSNKVTMSQMVKLVTYNKPMIVLFGNSPVMLQDYPLADTPFYFSSCWYTMYNADLTNFTQARLSGVVSTAGTAATKVTLKYYTSYSQTYSNYVSLGTSAIQISLAATGFVQSSWINIASGAKASGTILLCGVTGGDSAADPIVNLMYAEFR